MASGLRSEWKPLIWFLYFPIMALTLSVPVFPASNGIHSINALTAGRISRKLTAFICLPAQGSAGQIFEPPAGMFAADKINVRVVTVSRKDKQVSKENTVFKTLNIIILIPKTRFPDSTESTGKLHINELLLRGSIRSI